MIWLIVVGLAVAWLFYYTNVLPLNYWKKRGVEQGKPRWIFGHFYDSFLGSKNGTEIVADVYNQSPNARYTGMYRFTTPILVPRDPELIKQITVKNFEAFMDHPDELPTETDPLWNKTLISLKGPQWKDLRLCLSPSFTSSKMRTMFTLMTDCADNLIQHLLKQNKEVVTVEIMDLFTRYTNDVIATTAFGVQVDSLANPKNSFYEMSKEVGNFESFWKNFKILLFWLIPPVKSILSVHWISEDVNAYFSEIIKEAIKIREEKGMIRQDMLHLLLQARKEFKKQQSANGSDKEKRSIDLTDEDITAQAVIFIIAGFQSVASFISFTVYELAANPDIQEKLRAEIRETLEEHGGKVNYEAIMKMKYMDMVATESLRKWPHFTTTDRICTKSFTIEPELPGEKPLHVEKGTRITIPIYSIQRDPKNYPDPERFDPERFSPENKDNVNTYAYLPFGAGPRTCIGSRFAFLEAKIILFHVLSQFEIVPVEKSVIPLRESKSTMFSIKPEDDFWFGLKKIKT